MKENIWFTSDTHFSQERTLQLSRRPFKNVKEMDEVLISNWNSVVKENDFVYHLGDFGNGEIAQKLNGNIVLLYGNYERIDDTNIVENEKYFSRIYKTQKNLDLQAYKLMMCHEPSNMGKNWFNLFGHVHQLSMVKKHWYTDSNFMAGGYYACGLNVGTDCHRYTPIGLDIVEFYRNAILNHYDNETYW